MMWYAITGEDIPDSLDKRLEARPAHIQRIKDLQEEGRLLVAGPFPAIDSEEPGPAGFSGSLIIAAFESVEAATAWAEADPYATEGVFSSVTVKPFRKTLP